MKESDRDSLIRLVEATFGVYPSLTVDRRKDTDRMSLEFIRESFPGWVIVLLLTVAIGLLESIRVAAKPWMIDAIRRCCR